MAIKVALVGFSGSGKSTIAQALANRLAKTWLDTDQLVEQEAGCSIAELIREKGEPTFRSYETAALQKATDSDCSVIATGGGILLKPENAKLLSTWGVVVHLSVSADVATKRISEDEAEAGNTVRPLLAGGDPKAAVQQLMDKRKGLYDQADLKIATDNKSPKQVVEEILAALVRLGFDVEG